MHQCYQHVHAHFKPTNAYDVAQRHLPWSCLVVLLLGVAWRAGLLPQPSGWPQNAIQCVNIGPVWQGTAFRFGYSVAQQLLMGEGATQRERQGETGTKNKTDIEIVGHNSCSWEGTQ